MFVACPPNVFPPALLFPLSLSRLFLTPSAPKPSCGSVAFRHLQLSSTLIGASEVDSSTRVSWMLLRCAATTAPTGSDRGRGVEATRNSHNTLQNPLTAQMGDERIHWPGRVSMSRSQVRNVQPLSYEPEYPLLISNETRITVQSPNTEVLANRLIGTCAI